MRWLLGNAVQSEDLKIYLKLFILKFDEYLKHCLHGETGAKTFIESFLSGELVCSGLLNT